MNISKIKLAFVLFLVHYLALLLFFHFSTFTVIDRRREICSVVISRNNQLYAFSCRLRKLSVKADLKFNFYLLYFSRILNF